MEVPVPVPATLLEILWLCLGITFGRAFGKKLDLEIQETDWFKEKGKLAQWLLRRLLDFTHHWEIGLLLMVYFGYADLGGAIPWGGYIPELYWFGYGLVIDDLPDLPARLRKIFKGYTEWWLK